MTLEFENELGEIRPLLVKTRQAAARLKPLVAGDLTPFFSLTGGTGNWQASVFNRATPSSGGRSESRPAATVSVLDLIETKPLIVTFYCPCWGRYAGPYLNALVQLNEAIQAAGAELIVFSNESPKALARQGRTLDFLFAHDIDLLVSRQFGVYNEDNPVWDRVSGISDEAFTPALYVIGADRRITYDFQDENFDTLIDQEAIMTAVEALTGSDPELAEPQTTPLNPYARGFFALWLLGFLITAGVHFAPSNSVAQSRDAIHAHQTGAKTGDGLRVDERVASL